VLNEIQRINVDLGRAAEAWDGARYRLDVVRTRERATRARLRFARAAERTATRRLERLLVSLYESPQPSTLSVITGASSLDNVITRLADAQQVSDEQAAVVAQVRNARTTLRRQTDVLSREVAAARRNAARLAAQRAAISNKLRQRQRLLASIDTEIRTLRAEQRARERALARQARIRLQQQLAQARRAAEQARRERLRQLDQARAAALAQAHAAAIAQQRTRETAAPKTTPPAAPATTTRTAPPPTSTAPPPTSTAPPPTPTAPPPTPPTSQPLPPPAAPTPPAATSGNTEVVSIAIEYLGVPYRWGGASPQAGFDCSGLVMYVFGQAGISLPHFAAAQYHYGSAVSRDQLEPGDLVFFDHLNHVGIYIGNNQFIHAPHTGDVVRISSLDETWFNRNYVGARRIT
jgi:cell wall-associated NlpC family hydrolase